MPRVAMDVQTAVGYLMNKDTVTSTRLNCLVCLRDHVMGPAATASFGPADARPLLRAFAKTVAAGNIRVPPAPLLPPLPPSRRHRRRHRRRSLV